MLTLAHLLAIAAGASAGAISRWLLSLWLNQPGAVLPWGTLAANLAGGYLIGLVLGVISLYPEAPPWLRLMLITGFLGGFTTFSTFSAETFELLAQGAYTRAFAYSAGSLAGSLVFTGLGFATLRLFRSAA